ATWKSDIHDPCTVRAEADVELVFPTGYHGLGSALVHCLTEDVVPTVPVRREQNCLAIQCPRGWLVIAIIEGEASRVYKTRPAGLKFADVDIALRETPLQGEVLSVCGHAQTADVNTRPVRDSSRLAGGTTRPRVGLDFPEVGKVVLVWGWLQA